MKTFFTSLVFCAFTAISSIAADTSGIALPGPTTPENGFYVRTWTGPAGGIPSVVTNASAVLTTNVVTAVLKEQAVGGTMYLAQQAGGGSNNVVLRFDLSYNGGRDFTTEQPLTYTFSPRGANAGYRFPFWLPYTNLLGATHIKLTSVSNAIPAASAGAMLFPSNFTFTVRRF